MAEMAIVLPEEMDYFVQSIRPFQVNEIGSRAWIEAHQIVLKLNQQAHLEVRAHQEELVKELLVFNSKLPVLVHELFSILVWRSKILPKLLEINSNPNATFMLYTVLFHEATAASLIEIALFHQNGCESLVETSLDLIDYAVQAITQLIGLVNIDHYPDGKPTNLDETSADELQRQQRDLQYKIGLRCISILCYLVDKLDLLPLSAVNRLVETHDTPCLLSEILHCQPWRRHGQKGIEILANDQWQTVRGDEVLKITKIEAQTWLCFRQLLFNATVSRQYGINEFRQRELAKCEGMLNEHILDQIPPLAEFKHYLCTLQLSRNNGLSKTVLLEELPAIKENIIKKAKSIGYHNIVQQHTEIFLHNTPDDIMALAKQLNSAYNTELWEQMEDHNTAPQTNVCAQCKKNAEKKCVKCKNIYYCCRECQVKDWANHKLHCV